MNKAGKETIHKSDKTNNDIEMVLNVSSIK